MSVVPLIPLRRVDDLVKRIEELQADCERRGYAMLSFYLETAAIEGRHLRDDERRDREERQSHEPALWLPVPRSDS